MLKGTTGGALFIHHFVSLAKGKAWFIEVRFYKLFPIFLKKRSSIYMKKAVKLIKFVHSGKAAKLQKFIAKIRGSK